MREERKARGETLLFGALLVVPDLRGQRGRVRGGTGDSLGCCCQMKAQMCGVGAGVEVGGGRRWP